VFDLNCFQQIQNYLRWRTNGKPARGKDGLWLAKILKKEFGLSEDTRTRRQTRLEIYSGLYYVEKFKAQVDKEILETTPTSGSETPREFSSRKLSIYRKWRALAWQDESEQVKDVVEKHYNEASKKVVDEEDDENDKDPLIDESRQVYVPTCSRA
jgi:hypothetical protein